MKSCLKSNSGVLRMQMPQGSRRQRVQSLQLESDSECDNINIDEYNPNSLSASCDFSQIDQHVMNTSLDSCSPLGSPDASMQPGDSHVSLLAEYIPFNVAGYGSGGTVWIAQHKVTKQIVAIKCISSIQSREQQQRVQMELYSHLKSSRQDKNNHVVKLKFACWLNGRAWAVVEYCDGGNVNQMMKLYKQNSDINNLSKSNPSNNPTNNPNNNHHTPPIPKLQLYTPPTQTPKQHIPSWSCCLSLFTTNTQYVYAKDILRNKLSSRGRPHRGMCFLCYNSIALCQCGSRKRFQYVYFLPQTHVIEDADKNTISYKDVYTSNPKQSHVHMPFQGSPPKWLFNFPVWKLYGSGEEPFTPISKPMVYTLDTDISTIPPNDNKRKRSSSTRKTSASWMDQGIFDWSSSGNSSSSCISDAQKKPKNYAIISPYQYNKSEENNVVSQNTEMPMFSNTHVLTNMPYSNHDNHISSNKSTLIISPILSPMLSPMLSPLIITPTMKVHRLSNNTTIIHVPDATWHKEDTITSIVPVLKLPESLKKPNPTVSRTNTSNTTTMHHIHTHTKHNMSSSNNNVNSNVTSQMSRHVDIVLEKPTNMATDLMRKNAFAYVLPALAGTSTESQLTVDIQCHNNESMPDSAVAGVTYQLQLGLKHLHSVGILHRDITPYNVLFTSHGVVKVADLGVSTEISEKLEKKQTFVGTQKYMCAERQKGEGHSFGTDVWGAGCVAAEMALNQPFVEWLNLVVNDNTYDILQYDNNMNTNISSNSKKAGQNANLPFLAILSLMTHDPLPCLPLSQFSPFLSFFIQATVSPVAKRPTTNQLLTHPFLLYHISTVYQTQFGNQVKILMTNLKETNENCVFYMQWCESISWNILHNLHTDQDIYYINQVKPLLQTQTNMLQYYTQLYSTTILLYLQKHQTLTNDSCLLNLRFTTENTSYMQRSYEQKAQKIVKNILDIAKPNELDFCEEVNFNLVSGWWNILDDTK